MAAEHGASQVFDPTTEDVVAGIHKVTANQGIDVAFECAGIQATIDTALVALRSRGNYVNIALWAGAAQVSMNAVLLKEISITGEHNPCGRPSKSDCWIRYYWLRSYTRGAHGGCLCGEISGAREVGHEEDRVRRPGREWYKGSHR